MMMTSKRDILKICRKKEFNIKAKKVSVLNVPYKHVVFIWKGRISTMHMLLICLNSNFDNLFFCWNSHAQLDWTLLWSVWGGCVPMLSVPESREDYGVYGDTGHWLSVPGITTVTGVSHNIQRLGVNTSHNYWLKWSNNGKYLQAASR